ncbi:MAG TPA: DUF5715 family protein [Pyrinomonadaceae bacterium]
MHKRLLVLLVFLIAATGAVWAGFRFGGLNWHRGWVYASDLESNPSTLSWWEAVEKIKEPRLTEDQVAHEIPPELKHYEDRHWFLATQVAEVAEHNVGTCQDFVDLAGMHQRGEVVALPAVTQTYVLYKVGERADDRRFSRYYQPPAESENGAQSKTIPDAVTIELYGQTEVAEADTRLESERSRIESELRALQAPPKASNDSEIKKQISTLQNELNKLEAERERLGQFYSDASTSEISPHTRETLFRDYEVLQSLAKNLGGRSYDLNNPAERQSFKVHMLSSLRPEAVKILEEVAGAYYRQFNRPLPISSLFRPEQYQHALRRVNRNAVTIDTPPHSTGLAFDIDYRFMGVAEQNFVMNELARLKREGRIEVIRERNANYHVFAFLDGKRPNYELIRASLEAAGADPEQEESEEDSEKAEEQPAEKRERAVTRKQKVKTTSAKAKMRKRR